MKRVWIFSLLVLFSIPLLAQKSLLKKTLLNIDGQKVTAGEFLKMYEKNGTEGHDTTSLKDYLQLYINFRLKVLDAEKRGMDTLPAFKKELNSYRKQLARPYFTDKRVTDSLVKQAYQRLQYDIRASHILVRVSPNASPADTLKAWEKINRIRSEILHGMNFGQAAVKYSEDPSARDIKAIPGKRRGRRGNHGDLGFFSVFNMVYPFEEAAYNTPVDSVSKPIRTRFGYHLIKVTDKRPAMGVAEVEHIFVALKPGYTKADSLAKAEKIQEIYQKIKAGMPFEEAARKYSEDRGSADNGGKLPRFSSSRIVPQFVEQIDKLKPGQISKPFETIYGFHIIKLLDRKRPGSFKQEEARLKEQVARDQRAQKSKEVVLNRIKKENNLRIYQDAKTAIFQAIDTTVLSGHFKTENLQGSRNHALMEIGKKEPKIYVQQDFARFVEKNQHKGHYTNKAIMLDHLFKQFVDQNCLDYENRHLEDFHPDFKALMQEYHDGILLFNLMDKMVWSKAVKDTTGLKNYYAQHHKKYKHGAEVEAFIFSVPKNNLHQLDSIFKQYPDKARLIDSIAKLKVVIPGLKTDSGTYQKGDNKLIDNTPWKTGLSKPQPSEVGNRVRFIFIKKVIPPGEMSFDEARGLVASDYQDFLEKQWIAQLRRKYPVKVNEKVLNKLIKYEKEKKKQ